MRLVVPKSAWDGASKMAVDDSARSLASCRNPRRSWSYRLAQFSPFVLHTVSFVQVDLKVQQELLRHSDIRTTMNIYTQAVPDAMREANSRVVEMVLPTRKVG